MGKTADKKGDNNLNVIDLFAGCGGLSLGFEMAGYNIPLAIEKDEWASETYKYNHPKTKVITQDIKEITDLLNILPNNKMEITGIIGGPPCQGFSLSGNRDKNDPRNSLFMEFVRFVDHFEPEFFVMENVPGLLSMKTKAGKFVKDLIKEEFKKVGYTAEIFKLNAADYGVPQNRVRIFFIGIKNNEEYNREKMTPKITIPKPITIEQAIMDLPQIQSGEGIEEAEYPCLNTELTDYQKWARGNNTVIKNHIAMKHTERLIKRFSLIKCGQSVADVAKEHQQRKRGEADKISGKVYSQNNMRPFPDKPAPTIAASFQSNFIHPYLNRNFTAREGARLQSFPDNYIFHGKRTTMSWEKNLSQYQQIGNAVPPLLAKAVAQSIKNYFSELSIK